MIKFILSIYTFVIVFCVAGGVAFAAPKPPGEITTWKIITVEKENETQGITTYQLKLVWDPPEVNKENIVEVYDVSIKKEGDPDSTLIKGIKTRSCTISGVALNDLYEIKILSCNDPDPNHTTHEHTESNSTTTSFKFKYTTEIDKDKDRDAVYSINEVRNIHISKTKDGEGKLFWDAPVVELIEDSEGYYRIKGDVADTYVVNISDIDPENVKQDANICFANLSGLVDGHIYTITITSKNSVTGYEKSTTYPYLYKKANNRSVTGQKVHGAYQNNTNSCANCHSTHTSKSAALLTEITVYSTCISCHDGSLGEFNVFEANPDKDMGAGTFFSTGISMSKHMSIGILSLKSAPGYSELSESDKLDSEFNCASCHNPHGSNLPRLLNPNPNNYSNIKRAKIPGSGDNDGDSAWYGGKIADVIPVISIAKEEVPAKINDWYWNINEKPTGFSPSENFKAIKYTQAPGETVIQLFKYEGGWISVSLFDNGTNDPLELEGSTNIGLTGLTIDLKNGIISGPNISEVTSVTNIRTAFNFTFTRATLPEVVPENFRYEEFQGQIGGGKGALFYGFNEWCNTCHYSFNMNSDQAKEYGSNHHISVLDTVGDQSFGCATCHYSHGTDLTWMKGSFKEGTNEFEKSYDELMTHFDNEGANTLTSYEGIEITSKNEAIEYLSDLRLKLKRYPNSTSCYKCHALGTW